jgi:hypothetical protein
MSDQNFAMKEAVFSSMEAFNPHFMYEGGMGGSELQKRCAVHWLPKVEQQHH